jgi:hypothetical protein
MKREYKHLDKVILVTSDAILFISFSPYPLSQKKSLPIKRRTFAINRRKPKRLFYALLLGFRIEADGLPVVFAGGF